MCTESTFSSVGAHGAAADPQEASPWGEQSGGGWQRAGCYRLWLSDSTEMLWPCRFISWLLASLGMKIL